MGSSTPKNTTTTTKQEPPSWAVPSYNDLLNRAAYQTALPYQGYGGQQIAGFTPDQQIAQAAIRNQALNGTTDDAAANFTNSLLGGQGQFNPQANQYMGATTQVGTNRFAGQNPYLNQLVQDSQGDVTRNYTTSIQPGLMAQFNSSGAFGGTAHQQALAGSQRELADELGQVSTNLRGADYQNQQQLAEADINRRMQSQQIDLARNAGLSESLLGRQQGAWNDFQGRQMQGLALAPQTQQMGFFDAQQLAGIGGAQQEMNQSQLSQAYQNFLEQRDWGANRLGLLGSALGTINGGFQNGAVTSPNLNRPNPWVGAAGGAATGAGMGMAAGPVGAGVGALIGAGLGYFGSR